MIFAGRDSAPHPGREISRLVGYLQTRRCVRFLACSQHNSFTASTRCPVSQALIEAVVPRPGRDSAFMRRVSCLAIADDQRHYYRAGHSAPDLPTSATRLGFDEGDEALLIVHVTPLASGAPQP